jgi:hypothetical protein
LGLVLGKGLQGSKFEAKGNVMTYAPGTARITNKTNDGGFTAFYLFFSAVLFAPYILLLIVLLRQNA